MGSGIFVNGVEVVPQAGESMPNAVSRYQTAAQSQYLGYDNSGKYVGYTGTVTDPITGSIVYVYPGQTEATALANARQTQASMQGMTTEAWLAQVASERQAAGMSTTGAPGSGTSTTAAAAQQAGQSVMDFVKANYPWLFSMGLADQIKNWTIQGVSPEGIVAGVRSTPQYEVMFSGIRRTDGTMRMNEAQYLQTRDNYFQVGREYGMNWTSSQDVQRFFEQDVDPNELRDRMKTWDTIDKGSQDIKDAFYVYAGLKIGTDDLYAAIVDKDAYDALNARYTQALVSQPLDYTTWITRATQAGLNRVTGALQSLQAQGIDTADTVAALAKVDPNFARQMMDQLYHGGGNLQVATPSRYLSLSELLNSFDYAMIGGAAVMNGLTLPTQERVNALRQAGVDRAKALEAYGGFASQKELLAGMVQRANLGTGFSQSDFEKAVLLHSAPEQDLLNRAQSADKALSQSSGWASFSMGSGNRLRQQGLGLSTWG